MFEHNRDYFLYLLLISALLITVLFGVESYLQYSSSKWCFLSFLHKHNIITGYKVTFEPNRGIWHIMGWTGTFLMLIMHIYTLRKNARFMHEWGMLKHWLDFHIFCGVMGPILVTYHTTFKLGGIVSISYWSVVIVAVSGMFGRYIFGSIPRGIAGNELKMEEIESMHEEVTRRIEFFNNKAHNLGRLIKRYIRIREYEENRLVYSFLNMIKENCRNFLMIRRFKIHLKRNLMLQKKDRAELVRLLAEKLRLNRKVHFLQSAHRLFRYWHRFHRVFTVILYMIALIHIVVYYLFRVNI